MSKTPTYVIYTRCSTEEQQKGFSHEYQRGGIESAHKVIGWRCLGQYSDTMTGTSFVRDGLEQIYNLYKNNRGVLDYILVHKFDRFGRDVGDAFQTIKRFREIGIEINSPNKWIDYSDANYPLLLAIEFGMAQGESMKISDRTKDGLYATNLDGYYTGPCPVGYKRSYEQQRANGKKGPVVVIDEEKAAIVLKCYQLFADGKYTRSELMRRYKKQLGIERSQFLRLFTNPLYIGKIHLKAFKTNPPRVVDAKHEPIIPVALFEKVQDKINNEMSARTFTLKNSEIENFFYLKGLLHCAKSFKQMTAYQVTKKSGLKFYYYQPARTKGGQILNAIDAHQTITQALADIQITGDLYNTTKTILTQLLKEKQEGDRKRAAWLSGEIEKNQNRLVNLQEKYLDNEITKNDYDDLKQRCNTNLAQYREELITLRSNQENEFNFRLRLLDAMLSIADVFKYTTVANKKAMLRAIFPEGFVISDGVVLTSRINSYIDTMLSNTATYEGIKIKTGHVLDGCPVVGGQSDKDRTVKDRELLNLLFEAA